MSIKHPSIISLVNSVRRESNPRVQCAGMTQYLADDLSDSSDTPLTDRCSKTKGLMVHPSSVFEVVRGWHVFFKNITETVYVHGNGWVKGGKRKDKKQKRRLQWLCYKQKQERLLLSSSLPSL